MKELDSLRGRLRPEQIVSALVTEKLANNRYSIRIEEVVLPFQSRQPLNPGQKLLLKVEELTPTILLKKIGSIKTMQNGSLEVMM